MPVSAGYAKERHARKGENIMIGSRLGKWLIEREIGRGGMGNVYLARDDEGLAAALKVLSAELAKEPGFLHRFQRETEILAQLSHPNIVKLFESACESGVHYFAMEYVAGENFEQLLQARGRLPWREVLNAGLQICPALKHAHDRGIIHRDIKPPNLLRNSEGLVKLTDFGIAKVFAGRNLTHTGGVVGTAEYLSPEQASGKQATKRSDLYSLGVVFYTLLTGQTPFQGQSTAEVLHKHLYGQFSRPARLVTGLPREIDEVVCSLMEKDASHRPADALVLQRQLDSIRRKLERKSLFTVAAGPSDRTVAENQSGELPPTEPGPATLMSRAMREELDAHKRGSALWERINKVWVLLPLFILCVGVLAWGLWPKAVSSADELYAGGALLMASEDAADWERARDEYFEPLDRLYPNHAHQVEVARYRQQIDDRAALRRALRGIKLAEPFSEAQRFYLRGLRLCQEGDVGGAKAVWQNAAVAFAGVENEARWVRLCQQGLAELASKALPEQGRAAELTEIIRKAKSSPPAEAEQKRQALEQLYHDDSEADRILRNAGMSPQK
jgi:serine/threonine-protein kinase